MLFIVYKSVGTGENCTKSIGKIENVCYHNKIPKKGPNKQYIDSQLVKLNRMGMELVLWYTK